jgi:hypothetical protein
MSNPSVAAARPELENFRKSLLETAIHVSLHLKWLQSFPISTIPFSVLRDRLAVQEADSAEPRRNTSNPTKGGSVVSGETRWLPTIEILP